MKRLLLTLLCAFPFIHGFSQSAEIALSPKYASAYTVDSVQLDLNVQANSFNRQLTLSVAYSELPTGADIIFPVNPLSYPYSDSKVVVKINGGVGEGTYKFVVKASNGPVVDYDTCTIEILAKPCGWTVDQMDGSTHPKLAFESDGSVWGIGENNLWHYHPSTGYTYYPFNQINLPTAYYSDIKSDKFGNIWLASFDYGVIKFNEHDTLYYNTNNSSLPTNKINAIEIDQNGHLWAATSVGLVYFDGVFYDHYHTGNSGILGNEINLLHIDKNGVVWGNHYGEFGDFIFSFNGSDWSEPLAGNYFCTTQIRTKGLLIHPVTGDIWLANAGQVIRKEASHMESWTTGAVSNAHFTRLDGSCDFDQMDNTSPLTMSEITSMTISSKNEIWISGVGDQERIASIAKYDGIWHNYTTQNSSLPDHQFLSIFVDKNDVVWSIGKYHDEASGYTTRYSAISSRCQDEVIASTTNLNNQFEGEIQIYPNPANDIIEFSLGGNLKADEIHITDVFGRTVLFNSFEQVSEGGINIQTLSPGLYLVNFKMGSTIKNVKLNKR